VGFAAWAPTNGVQVLVKVRFSYGVFRGVGYGVEQLELPAESRVHGIYQEKQETIPSGLLQAPKFSFDRRDSVSADSAQEVVLKSPKNYSEVAKHMAQGQRGSQPVDDKYFP